MSVRVSKLIALEPYVLAADAPLRMAIERLTVAAEHKFQIVCDERGRLIGTVTDGDIRRALLRGIGLGDPVSRCMQQNPTTGRVDAESRNRVILRAVGAQTAFLPLLDSSGVLRGVLVRGTNQPETVALVMAGGFGRRLGERTKDTPKPLIKVGEKPILEHILDKLEGAGARQIYISVHYLAERIFEFVAARPSPARIDLLRESKPLGTAGAIGLLPDPMPAPFVIINGDILTNVDFVAMHDFHVRHGYDATLAVAHHDVTVPYGVVRMDDEGHFHGIDEKPTLTHFVAAGIYLLSPEFRSLVRKGDTIDMPELLERGRTIGLKTGLFPIHEYWTDVGRPEDLENARRIERAASGAAEQKPKD